MPPKRRKTKSKAKGRGLVKYDVVCAGEGGADGPDGGAALGSRLASCLYQKGFCVVDFNLGQDLLALAQREGFDIEADAAQDGRFAPPPEEVADGLLGEEGSSLVCELDVDLADDPDGPGLRAADAHLARVADLLRPFGDRLGFEVHGRSRGLLHVAGYPADSAPKLTEAECQKWLAEFGRHRLMLILVLGPSGGVLELAPFADEDANSVELQLEAGSTVVLRADALSHKYAATAKSLALTCWLSQAKGRRGRRGDAMVLSPQYQELSDWKEQRLLELKKTQVIGEEGQVWSPAVPRDWQAEANHMFPTGPQVGLRSLSCKFPQTYSPEAFWRGLGNGVDLAIKVPMFRWDHTSGYDPAPDSWKWSKTCCQHSCFVDGLDQFDCKFFGISPFEAKGMDPNQRQILETSYEALQLAGFSKKGLMRSLIGVYIAAAISEFSLVPLGPESTGATSGANSITSNRISFCLGMQGPSYTLDNQGAGVLSCVTAAAQSLRMQTSRYRPNHSCLIGGTYIQMAGSIWVLASSQGWLSRQGRCFTFDYCADGYIKCDGIGNAVLSPVSESVDGKDVVDESKPLLGTVVACSMSHTGRGASLTAPSGPQERELILDAVRQASIGVADVDAVECWGESGVLKDAVEVEALRSALRGEEDLLDTPLALGTGKTQFGFMCEAAGMGALIRVLVGQRLGYMAPGLHLCELNPHIDAWSGEEPCLFASETLAYGRASSYHGLTGKSIGGTMAHVVSFASLGSKAQASPGVLALPPVELHMPISFWPGGGGELGASQEPASARPYHVVGSWAEWGGAEAMQSEGGGVYGLTVVMGPNRFEQFQILLDGRDDQVLHPDLPAAPSGAAALGPAPAEACRHLRWTIDGRGATGAAGAAFEDEAAGAVAALEDDAAAQAPEAPLLPGSAVRVRLRVAGKWRAVDWEKVADPDPAAAGADVDGGRYYIVGHFNDWTFVDELRPVHGSMCSYQAEVGPLPWAGGQFQVVRNQDWCQTFYPLRPDDLGEHPEEVLGPTESPEQLVWSLGGLRGDCFRVEFKRLVDAKGLDERSISWKRIRRR